MKKPLKITLRDAAQRDVPALYRMHADPEANRAGGFKPRTRPDFFRHWKKVLGNRLNLKKVIVLDGEVAGYVVSFFRTGTGKPKIREVGYWIAREHWGKGLASEGLKALLQIHHTRPLIARVAKSNPASRRVAENAGFKVYKEDSYVNESGVTIREYVLKLGSRKK